MSHVNWQLRTRTLARPRYGLALVLMVGLAAAGAGAPLALAENPPAPSGKSAEKTRTDLYGDPLPPGALARMGTLHWRHSAPVYFVGYLSSGKQILTASEDGFFRIWDSGSGKEIRRFGPGPHDPNPRDTPYGGSYLFFKRTPIVVLSSDGATLAVAEEDSIIRLWDVAAGKELRTFDMARTFQGRLIRGATPNMAPSPDGKLLATQAPYQVNPVIQLWDTASGKAFRQVVRKVPPETKVSADQRINNALVFLPNGKSLLAADMERGKANVSAVRLFDVASGNEIRRIEGGQPLGVTAMAVTSDGKTLAVTWANQKTRLYDLPSGAELRAFGTSRFGGNFLTVYDVVFAPGDKLLATWGMSSRYAIELWNAESGELLRVLGGPGRQWPGVHGLSAVCAFSPDGKQLADVSTANLLRLWDVASGKEIRPADSHEGGVTDLSVSRDGKVLTTYATDQTMRQWDVRTGKELRKVDVSRLVTHVAFAADGKLAAFQTIVPNIELMDPTVGKRLRVIRLREQRRAPGFRNVETTIGLTLSPEGKLLAVRDSDQGLRLFETAEGKEIRKLTEEPPTAANGAVPLVRGLINAMSPLAFSPDGSALAAVGGSSGGPAERPDGKAVAPPAARSAPRVWDLVAGGPGRLFQPRAGGIFDLAFSPDGRRLVTANTDRSVSLWEVLTGKEYLHIPSVVPAQPFPLGPSVFWGGSLRLALAPDGRTLAVGSADPVVRLWDLRAGKLLGEFKGHDGPVLAAAFASDGRTLFSSSADTTVLVWDVSRLIPDNRVPPIQLAAAQGESLWQDLAGEPAKGIPAIEMLASATREAVALLGARLQPITPVDAKRVAQLIADLDNAKYGVRQQATQALQTLGELAQPALQKLLAASPPQEVRRRVEKVLDQIATSPALTPEAVRSLRAVQVLEQVGTPGARQLLQRLAGGAPGAKLTREAGAAVIRMDKRSQKGNQARG